MGWSHDRQRLESLTQFLPLGTRAISTLVKEPTRSPRTAPAVITNHEVTYETSRLYSSSTTNPELDCAAETRLTPGTPTFV